MGFNDFITWWERLKVRSRFDRREGQWIKITNANDVFKKCVRGVRWGSRNSKKKAWRNIQTLPWFAGGNHKIWIVQSENVNRSVNDNIFSMNVFLLFKKVLRKCYRLLIKNLLLFIHSRIFLAKNIAKRFLGFFSSSSWWYVSWLSRLFDKLYNNHFYLNKEWYHRRLNK